MIKAIIFDHGGVISENGSFVGFARQYAAKFGKDPDKLHEAMLEVWFEARVGKADSKEFWKRVGKFVGVSPVRAKKDILEFFLVSRNEILSLITKLRANYKLGLLSNQIEDWFEEIQRRDNLDKLFDVIVTSYNAKLAKPDISIYKQVVEKLGVKPQECIFIDDLEVNIPPARELGMKAILFKDTKQLRKKLKKLKIKF